MPIMECWSKRIRWATIISSICRWNTISTRAMQTDELSGTINYAEVYELLKREMAKPSKLLEHVVGRIGDSLFAAYPSIKEIQLSVTKINPPMGADSDGAGVEVVLTNDKT